MSRLIDKDAFAEEMKKRQDACKEWTQRTIDTADEENYLRSCGAYTVFVETKLLLEKQPTIDAVEVTRCRDCKWYVPYTMENKTYKMCRKAHLGSDDFFCADGERRTE